MYKRNERGFLLVQHAWTIPHLPYAIIVEMPDGKLKFFGVRQSPYPPSPTDNELRAYKGYHPPTIPTADEVTGLRLAVFGLAQTEADTDVLPARPGRPVVTPEGTKLHNVNLAPDVWDYLTRNGSASAEISRLVEAEKAAK
jgi:hypothetical protein